MKGPIQVIPWLVFLALPSSLWALTDEFDDDPLASPDWELYQPLGGVSFTTDSGFLTVTIPAGIVLDHWTTVDSATQLRRWDMPEDFILETRVRFLGSGDPQNPLWPPPDEPFQPCLMVYFSQFDVFQWGFYRGTTLRLERSGQNNLCQVDPGLQELSLQVKKTGTQYSFSWREFDGDAWNSVCTVEALEPPLYVGYMFKTWGNLTLEETFEFDYFTLDEVPEEAPAFQVPCDFESPDRAWLGMPYLRELEVVGFPFPAVEVLSGPPDLTFDPAGNLVSGWTPDSFDPVTLEFRATSDLGEDTRSWDVDVGAASLLHDDEFDEDPGLNVGFWEFYEPQRGIAYSMAEVEPGSSWWRLQVPLSGDFGQNFDHWTTLDRAPQLRHYLVEDGDFLIETRVRIAPEAAPAADAPFLAGLMIFFSTFDLIHWNIGQERIINGNTTNLFLERSGINNIAHGYVPDLLTGVPVKLRADRKCDLYSFYYQGEGEDTWTLAGTYRAAEPPVAVGLIMKTWGGGTSFVADFDYFDIVEPGPKVIFAVDPGEGAEPLEVDVDATGSSSPAGNITQYDWDFGDGETASGVTQSHTYANRGVYRITLTVTDESGDRGAFSRMVRVLFRSGDVSPWTSIDIGNQVPEVPGGARLEDGSCMRILAGGGGISRQDDQFHFIYQEMEGNGAVVARLDSAQWENNARIGVMLREDPTPESPNASMLFGKSLLGSQYIFSYRDAVGATTRTRSGSQSVNPPGAWVRIERQGDEFIGSFSPDGLSWVEVDRKTIVLPEILLGGIAATSGDPSDLSTEVEALLCDVKMEGPVQPPAAPAGLTAGAGDAQVSLDWDDNSEEDLMGYHVFRATSPGGPYIKITTELLAESEYLDTDVTNETTYYYVVAAVNPGGSGPNSDEVSATPTGISEPVFRRGDADANGAVELTDVIRALTWQFVGGVELRCQDAADIDDDGAITLTDAIRSLNYQFVGVANTIPEAPGPFDCGPDVNVDVLPPCDYSGEICQ